MRCMHLLWFIHQYDYFNQGNNLFRSFSIFHQNNFYHIIIYFPFPQHNTYSHIANLLCIFNFVLLLIIMQFGYKILNVPSSNYKWMLGVFWLHFPCNNLHCTGTGLDTHLLMYSWKNLMFLLSLWREFVSCYFATPPLPHPSQLTSTTWL